MSSYTQYISRTDHRYAFVATFLRNVGTKYSPQTRVRQSSAFSQQVISPLISGTPAHSSSCVVFYYPCILISGSWRHVLTIYSQYSKGSIDSQS